MHILSRRLGLFAYDPSDLIEFPHGIPAFEQSRRFLLVARAHSTPILFLQSVDDPALSLPLIDADMIAPDYHLALAGDEAETLRLKEGAAPSSVRIFFVLAQFENAATVNLVAPIVVHLAERRGVQAIRADRLYSAVHPITALDPAFTPC